MKVAIVTFIRAYNHGAILQGYALYKTLSNLGADVEMLDYEPEYFKRIYNVESFKKWLWLPGPLLSRFPKFLLLRNRVSKRNKKFDRFIRRNIHMSQNRFADVYDLNNVIVPYDTFISGSDQVWNNSITNFDPVFFLDFPTANKSKKISYAASFGFSSIPEELKSEYKRLLSNWDYYSVREKNGVDILNELLNISATQCCDPTLLLSHQEWNNVLSSKREKEKYILVYSAGAIRTTLRYAQQLANEKNMKLIKITSVCSREVFMGEITNPYQVDFRVTASPDEFLSLISNASYVITDSFHATVFSLLFHTPFLTLIKTDKINDRALDLMTITGTENRTLEDHYSQIDQPIDWQKVDNRIEAYREKSLEYLKKIFI